MKASMVCSIWPTAWTTAFQTGRRLLIRPTGQESPGTYLCLHWVANVPRRAPADEQWCQFAAGATETIVEWGTI